jgi:hypothetical protein
MLCNRVAVYESLIYVSNTENKLQMLLQSACTEKKSYEQQNELLENMKLESFLNNVQTFQFWFKQNK